MPAPVLDRGILVKLTEMLVMRKARNARALGHGRLSTVKIVVCAFWGAQGRRKGVRLQCRHCRRPLGIPKLIYGLMPPNLTQDFLSTSRFLGKVMRFGYESLFLRSITASKDIRVITPGRSSDQVYFMEVRNLLPLCTIPSCVLKQSLRVFPEGFTPAALRDRKSTMLTSATGLGFEVRSFG